MEESKIMVAIAAELKEIKSSIKKLEENKPEQIDNAATAVDYVAETEQRFIQLNKKLDTILLYQKQATGSQRTLVGIAMALAIIAISKMLIDVLRAYFFANTL